MHVLFLASWFETPLHPTAGQAVKDLAYALSRQGVSTNILFQSLENVPEFSDDKVIQIWHSRFRMRGRIYPIISLFSIFSFYQVFKRYIIKNGIPDLVNVHSYSVMPFGAYISKKYNIPLVYSEHSSKIGLNKINFIEKRRIQSCLSYCKKVIAVSNALKNRMNKNFRCKIEVIPNTIDFNLFSFDEKMGTSHDIIMINLLNKNKQVDKGIEVFKIWNRRYPDSKLFIIGDGPERINLERLAKELNIFERVLFLGELKIDRWMPILKSSACLLLTSKYETFGVVVLEAIASGTPVVALENQGIDDIVFDSVYKLSPQAAFDEICNEIERALLNYNISTMQGIREKAQGLFSYQTIAKKYLDVYNDFI